MASAPSTLAVIESGRALEAPQLGTNDRPMGTSLAEGVRVIASADRGFDGVRGVRRVDPLDERGRRRLLSRR